MNVQQQKTLSRVSCQRKGKSVADKWIWYLEIGRELSNNIIKHGENSPFFEIYL